MEFVGCNNPWNEWVGPETAKSWARLIECNKTEDLTNIDKILVDLSYFTINQLEKKTNCIRPCKYTVYSLSEEVQIINSPGNTSVGISLASDHIISKKEAFIFSFSSLVAEFGGTLGLFVGFSFFMIWNWVEKLFSKCFYE